MAVIKANLELCQGYANCVVAADDAFDIDCSRPRSPKPTGPAWRPRPGPAPPRR
jgi:hypothetical protein